MYSVLVIDNIQNKSYEFGAIYDDPERLSEILEDVDNEIPTPWSEYVIAIVEENDVQTNPSLH